jgi:hypothetical protein
MPNTQLITYYQYHDDLQDLVKKFQIPAAFPIFHYVGTSPAALFGSYSLQ